jgi:hypothetical protein
MRVHCSYLHCDPTCLDSCKVHTEFEINLSGICRMFSAGTCTTIPCVSMLASQLDSSPAPRPAVGSVDHAGVTSGYMNNPCIIQDREVLGSASRCSIGCSHLHPIRQTSIHDQSTHNSRPRSGSASRCSIGCSYLHCNPICLDAC